MNKLKILGTIVLVWNFGKVLAQNVLLNKGDITIQSAAVLFLGNTHLQNDAGGTITNNGTISIGGGTTGRDIINNGTFNSSTGSIEMIGTTEQQVQGSSVVNVGTFTVNNGGNGVSVTNTGALRIHNTLNLTNGKLFTANASPVLFAPTANNPSETNTNHIVGTAIMEPRNIGTNSLPTFLMLSMAAGDDIGNVEIRRRTGNGTATSRGFVPTTGVATIGANQGIAAHWEIDNSIVGNRDVTISWISAWDNSKDLTQMRLWRTETPYSISTSWFPKSAVVDMSMRSFTFTSDVLKNAWTTSDLLNPLPVELLTFDVKLLKGKDVELTWLTKDEINVKNYIIERSMDNFNFETIHTENALNQKVNNYKHYDLKANEFNKNILYYRLALVDKDGKRSHSVTKAVYFNKVFWVSVYPNPYQDVFHLNIQNPSKQKIEIRLIDNLGRMHLQHTLPEEEEIIFTSPQTITNLAAGTYFLQIINKDQQEFIKIVKK